MTHVSTRRIERKPSPRKVTELIGPFRWVSIEKKIGERDSQENQIRPCGEGFTTPYVDARSNSCEKYINNTYAIATKLEDGLINEAKKQIAEANLILSKEDPEVDENGEKAARQRRYLEAERMKREGRLKELLMSLSETKALIESIDEKLKHHIETAEGICMVHINNYWRGVLKGTGGKEVSYSAAIPASREYEGRAQYTERRDELIRSITDVLVRGGAVYEA